MFSFSFFNFRPLFIPVHSLLTMESFSLSSNIIPGSSTSILRYHKIIVQDKLNNNCAVALKERIFLSYYGEDGLILHLNTIMKI